MGRSPGKPPELLRCYAGLISPLKLCGVAMPALTSSARPPGAEANEHFSSRDLNSLSAWLRWSLALGLVSAVTLAFRLLPFAVHTATLLAAYLLAVLALATTLRLPETVAAILAATLELNYFFLPPVGTLTIA